MNRKAPKKRATKLNTEKKWHHAGYRKKRCKEPKEGKKNQVKPNLKSYESSGKING